MPSLLASNAWPQITIGAMAIHSMGNAMTVSVVNFNCLGNYGSGSCNDGGIKGITDANLVHCSGYASSSIDFKETVEVER